MRHGIGALLLMFFCASSQAWTDDQYIRVKINNTIFAAKVSATQKAQMQGLMYVKALKPREGMLFPYENPQSVHFWMKNTLIPLDIMWIDEHNTIVGIQKNTPPCLKTAKTCPLYPSNVSIKYVFEVAGGTADRDKLEPGMKVSFDEGT